MRENERALKELRSALRVDLGRAETHFLLARTHRRMGNFDKVSPFLRRAQKLGGDPQRAQRETWLLLAQSGQLREAEPHLADLLMDPRDDGADICEAYVHGLFANLRVDEALQLLDLWQKQYPEDPEAFFMRAYLLDALSLFPESVAAYRAGLNIAPDRTTMRRRLAQVLMKTREFDEADGLLRRCVQEAPEDREAAAVWATCLFERGETQEARQVLDPLLAKGSGDFQIRKLAGEIAVAEARFQEAVPHLRVAVEQCPHDTTARYALANALKALGHTDEAQPHFDYVDAAKEPLDRLTQQLSLAVEQPKNAELRFDIATTLMKYGSPDDAMRWLRNVLELEPNHQGALEALASWYQVPGDQPRASVLPQSQFEESDSNPDEE